MRRVTARLRAIHTPPPAHSAVATPLLGFLHAGPLTGWDLVATAQMVIGDFWSLTQSQVYRELATMADAGLVAAGERGRRDRRPHTVTDAGRLAFAAWVDREPGSETIRFPLLLTIAFGRHLPPEWLAAFVRDHSAVHADRLTRYEEMAAAANAADDPDPYAAATLDFGLAYQRSVLAWFDRLPETIRGRGARPTAVMPTWGLVST